MLTNDVLFYRHTRRGKMLDKLVVSQGIRFDRPPQTATESLPPAVDRPTQLPSGKTEQPHTFPCPTNTAGTAKIKERRRTGPPSASPSNPESEIHVIATNVPSQSARMEKQPNPTHTPGIPPSPQSTPVEIPPIPILPVSPAPSVPLQTFTVTIDGQSYQLTQSSQPAVSSLCPADCTVPYTTQRYRKRKLDQEKAGIFKRKYTRKKEPSCKFCGQARTEPTHRQYFMNWWCAATATCTFDDWKAEMLKKGYGKKAKHQDMPD